MKLHKSNSILSDGTKSVPSRRNTPQMNQNANTIKEIENHARKVSQLPMLLLMYLFYLINKFIQSFIYLIWTINLLIYSFVLFNYLINSFIYSFIWFEQIIYWFIHLYYFVYLFLFINAFLMYFSTVTEWFILFYFCYFVGRCL